MKWRKDVVAPSSQKMELLCQKGVLSTFAKAVDGNLECPYRNGNQKVETRQFLKHTFIVGSDYSDYSQFPPSLPTNPNPDLHFCRGLPFHRKTPPSESRAPARPGSHPGGPAPGGRRKHARIKPNPSLPCVSQSHQQTLIQLTLPLH